MNNKQNKFLSVSYQLHTIDSNGTETLEEETKQGRPYQFISGFGFSLDAFEQQIVNLKPADKFDFILTPEEGFGQYEQEAVHKINRDTFVINGKFDEDNVFPGAYITLTDTEEHRFMARVAAIDDDSVTLDTNHPLAGKSLHFTGVVLENRDATTAEIQNMLNNLSCDCGNCEGGCGGCGGCH